MLLSKDLKYSFSGGKVMTFPDIKLERGEHCLLLGQSGSGKTTLLYLLTGMRTPQFGTIQIGGTMINQLSPSKLDHFRGKHIGLIFQQSHFIRSLNVEKNLALAQYLAGVRIEINRIEKLLQRLNIAHKIHAKTTELSVGEQQRVAIARALINSPDIIFADEPTSALDDTHAEDVINLLKEEAAFANASLMIVTHDHRIKNKINRKIELNPL